MLSTIGMFQKLAEERPNENVLTCAVGAYMALLMLHLGAGGKTRDSLSEVLKLSHHNNE